MTTVLGLQVVMTGLTGCNHGVFYHGYDLLGQEYCLSVVTYLFKLLMWLNSLIVNVIF